MTSIPRLSEAQMLRNLRRAARFTETGEGARIVRAGQDVTDQVRAQAALPRPTHAAPATIQ